MRIDAVPIGKNPPEDINVIIEVSVGGEPIKYEMDKDAGAMYVDRFLYTPMRYPGNYGFVPHTLCGDGDPIDVIVVNQRPIVPGAIMNCRPIGVLLMEDESGQDEKIIAVPSHKLSKRYDEVHDITDVPEITIAQVKHFFEHYKDLEPGKWVKVTGVEGADAAKVFAEQAFSVLAVILFVFVAVVEVAMPWLMPYLAPGFDSVAGKMEMATEFSRIAFPYLLFISLVALQSGVLNAFGKFTAAAAAPVFVLRQVRNGVSSSPPASNARDPCIIALTPMAP